MSVNEKLMAPGTFNVFLKLSDTPNSVINNIVPWGNLVLTPTRVKAEEFTDAQLRNMARYVGIITSQTIGDEGIEVAGKGILSYLGDTDSRGLVLARNAGVGAVRSYSNDTLEDVIDRSNSSPFGILRDESAAQRAVRKGTITEVSFDDTVLLLNFDGSNGATTTTDGSNFTSNQVITFSGTSEISTSQNKFGGSSLKLTTDGFVTVADRPELDLTYQDFTVEWWEYRTSTSGNPTAIARNNATFSPYIIGKAVSGRNKAFITHDGTSYSASEGLDIDMGSIDLNQWNHFALSRKGGSFRSFKNGVVVSTVDRPDLFVRVSSDSLQIGKGQGGNFFEGFIDGLVITRGSAKYYNAFTPSTSAPTKTTANKTYTGKHYMESAYKSIKTISTSLGSEFKMNNDGTLDAGPASALFSGHGTSTPQGMIVRRMSGPDPAITGYSGVDLSTEFVAEDFVSRVELIASQYGKEINLGQADEKSVPYKDLFGNTLERIQILSENDVPDSLRDVRAEAYLNEYNKIDKTLSVGLEDYDISGDINVGDIIYVYDPEVGFEDTQADATLENRDRFEITYQGQILNPVKIRVMGLQFPITSSMGVYYRDRDGVYTDLTDYVQFEVGVTQIDVGSTQSNINEDLRGSASVIAVGGANEFTVPGAPTGFSAAKGVYQDGAGRPFAFAKLSWTEPNNTDGTRITDGNFYRVRYRQVTDVDGNNLIDSNDNQITDYEYLTVEFGTTSVVIKGLGISNTYEFGVAAIDNSGFSGGFAVITAEQMPKDTIAPPEPVAPTGTFGSVASSAAKVQITHKLGAAKTVAGATISSPTNFSLPRDIDHLNVYRGTTSNFTISSSNFVGEIQARSGHIDLEIPAVNTFDVTTQNTAYYRVTAVDVAGNESSPSTAAQVNEVLIDTAFINDAAITTAKVGTAQITDAKIDTLTASKITAGTISGKEIIVDTDTATDPSNPVLGKIRSSNYSTGSAGWIINSDGSAEFQNATIRGSLNASDMTTGTLNASNVAITNLNADNITTGTLDFDKLSITSANIISTLSTNAILSTISNGAIDQAKLGNISANKITTGTLDANNVTIDNLTIGTGQVTGSFSGNVISGGTINGTTVNAGTITTGTLNLSNLTVSGSMSADRISGGSINANIITGTASLDGLNVGTGGIASLGTLSMNNKDIFNAADVDVNSLTSSGSVVGTNGIFSGYVSGDEFRGNNNTVDIHRSGTANGIKISGSGSGAYLYGFSFSGTQQTIYSPFSGVSDERLKENVANLTLGLDEINALRPVTFDWKASDIDDVPNERYGFIAQEVEEVIPSMVSTSPAKRIETSENEDGEIVETEVDNFITLDDGTEISSVKEIDEKPLVYMLVKAVQELSAKNDELESRLEALEG